MNQDIFKIDYSSDSDLELSCSSNEITEIKEEDFEDFQLSESDLELSYSGGEEEIEEYGHNFQQIQKQQFKFEDVYDLEAYLDREFPNYITLHSIIINYDQLEDIPHDDEEKIQKQLELNHKFDYDLMMAINILLFISTGFEQQNILRNQLSQGFCSTNDDMYYDNRFYNMKLNNSSNINVNNNHIQSNNQNHNKNHINNNNNKDNYINNNCNHYNNTQFYKNNTNLEGIESYTSFTFQFNPVSQCFEFNNQNLKNHNFQ